MSIHRKAARRDGNEGEIIEALEMAGASVMPLSGDSCLDLLVGFRDVNYWLEVKEPKGRLTEGQQLTIENWRGQCAVVRSVDDALRVIGAIT